MTIVDAYASDLSCNYDIPFLLLLPERAIKLGDLSDLLFATSSGDDIDTDIRLSCRCHRKTRVH